MSSVPGAEARAGRFPGPSLMPDLHAIQSEHGWLPRDELVRLARERRRPLYEVEGLISFYPHFLTEPPPKVELACCHDLSCWLQGGEDRIAELRERYGDDLDVHLREVSCIGRCDAAPAVAVNEFPAAAAQADELVEAARSNGTSGRVSRPTGADRRARTTPTSPARATTACCAPRSRASSTRAGSSPSSRNRACAGWAGPAFPRAPSGSSWQSRRRSPSTRSATPTSLSPAPSRIARSWPSSRTSCWRACCSACS